MARSLAACLVFNTTCAKLRLAARPSEALAPAIVFDIINIAGKVVSQTEWMHVDSAKANIVPGKEYGVIVLGAARWQMVLPYISDYWGSRRLEGCFDLSGFWDLRIMITEKEGYLSRRIAIGAVSVLEWTIIKPQWETVFLV